MNIPQFTPADIVFSFAAISDWHIKDEDGQYNQQKLISALAQLWEKAAEDDPRGLAAVVAAGDLTHDGKVEEIRRMRRTLESAIDLGKTALVYVVGNHDKHDPDCNPVYNEVFSDIGELYDACELSPDGAWGGNRHVVVRGVHFLTMGPEKYYKKEPNTYTETSKAWLDRTLADITAREPNAYVFVITHLLMWGTCYGSERGFFYASDDLNPILSKYPQAVTFGGHLHYPLNDERAIMQGAFTSMETATLSDMLIDGHGLQNVRKNTKTEGNTDFGQGLLVQIDGGGNLRVTRMDFHRHATIGEPWYLDAPRADGAHLTRYTDARRENKIPASVETGKNLSFEQTVIEVDGDGENNSVEVGGTAVTVCFETAGFDRPMRVYTVRVADAGNGETVGEYGYLTDFYRHPDPATMAGEVRLTLPCLPAGDYTVSVSAQDCWGNEAKPLVGRVTVG